jgi:hypothetical protein
MTEGQNVPERDRSIKSGFTMLDGERVEQTADDDVSLDAKPACVALVPWVQTARWSHSRPLPRPNAIFVTQLIATVDQDPQTSSWATAFDANAAYTANQHRLAGAGIRARQTV